MSKPKDDLISRAAAIDAIVSTTAFSDVEYIKNLCQNPAISEDWLGGVCDAINAVEDVNAVDAAPVVHSFWHWTQDGYVYCENCTYPLAKTKVNIDGEERHLYLTTNYCAHCGAKMDGERRDECETGND